jgi:hypothetical protein
MQSENRANIIQVVTSPLGFFALSLLIVEGFLTIALVFSNLDQGSKFIGMIIGAFLFIIVVSGVLILVWKTPTNLTFGEKSHLHMLEMQKAWGNSEKPDIKSNIEQEEISVSPSSSVSPSQAN